MEIPEQYAGQTGTCKNCGEKVGVPKHASKSQVLPSISQKTSAIPYAWIAGASVLLIVLALGTYMFVSRDASLPTATSRQAPSARRIIEFPTDRVVGELRLRDIGDPWWGTPIGEARGPFLVPDGKEVGVSVNRYHAPDLSFLRDLAADDLSFLMISRPEIDDRQLQYLEGLTGLKSMFVVFCRITDNGLRSFSGLTRLEFLGLSGTSITDDGLALLSSLEQLTGLGLGRTKITHRGIRAVNSLQNIQNMSLSGAVLTQPMVDALKEFPNLVNLIIDADFLPYPDFVVDPSLRLDPVVPTSPESILLLKHLPQLHGLTLRGKLNDDSLIPALSQLTFLKGIGLGATSITPEGRDRLRRALPNCTITP